MVDVLDRRDSIPAFRSSVPEEREDRGIFVKNYIDQSQEFAVVRGGAGLSDHQLLRAKRIAAVLLIAFSFVVNMAFVIVSRTALVTMPIMLAVFALLHLNGAALIILWARSDWRGRRRPSCADAVDVCQRLRCTRKKSDSIGCG